MHGLIILWIAINWQYRELCLRRNALGFVVLCKYYIFSNRLVVISGFLRWNKFIYFSTIGWQHQHFPRIRACRFTGISALVGVKKTYQVTSNPQDSIEHDRRNKNIKQIWKRRYLWASRYHTRTTRVIPCPEANPILQIVYNPTK
jgi:hypothetical protein